MPKYRATLRVSGLSGDNPRLVRSELDEQLRNSGLQNCQVVSIDLEQPMAPRQHADESVGRLPAARNAGGFLLMAAAVWAALFFWWMLSVTPE